MSWCGNLFADRDLSHRAKAVFMYLRERGDAEGKSWPGIRTISADLNLSRSTVKRALTDLEKSGYLERTHRFRENGSYTSNLYTIHK